MGGRAQSSRRGSLMGVYAHRNRIRIRFTYRGVRCQPTLALEPNARNLEYTRNLRGRILDEIGRGTFNYAEHFPNDPKAALFGGPRAGITTVAQALETWHRAHQRHVTAGTWCEYRKSISKHLAPVFGETLLVALSRADIQEWIATCGLGPKTVNNTLIPLRRMLTQAHADGLITTNPMEHVHNLKTRPAEPDPFTPAEVAAILAVLDGQVLNLYEVLFQSGFRPSEAIALRWADVDFVHGFVFIERAKVRGEFKEPKTRAGRRKVRLSPRARAALERQKAHTFLADREVFLNPATGRPWVSEKAMRESHWNHALKRAGVRRRVPYQCRHTYASVHLTAGENPAWVARQMGHANMSTFFGRYARWIDEAAPEAGAKADALWRQA